MGQKKKHLIFGILTEFQVFLAHIFVKIGGGCGIRTHVTGTVKQFSRLPRYDRFDNPPYEIVAVWEHRFLRELYARTAKFRKMEKCENPCKHKAF